LASLNEMITVRGGGDLDFGQAGGHELKPRHLGGRVLHGDAVGAQIDVAVAPLEFLIGGVEVVHQDLFGKGQSAAETGAGGGDAFVQMAVDVVNQLDRGTCLHCHRGSSTQQTAVY